jgi:hypothetical protein
MHVLFVLKRGSKLRTLKPVKSVIMLKPPEEVCEMVMTREQPEDVSIQEVSIPWKRDR